MPDINWSRVTDECVARLSRLLQFDTTNPPGNETPAARWIEDQLRAAGIPTEFFEPGPGRGNVVGRIGPAAGSAAGDGQDDQVPARRHGGRCPAPADQGLLLLGHTDVVPARAEEWSHHPFSGDVADGCVWGRGALDMKGTVAMWLTLTLLAQEQGPQLKRPLIFMANADEEAGGAWGARWVAENRPDLVRVAGCLNEGGGRGQHIGEPLFFTYQTAEKTPCPVRLVARGRPGHASAPHEDNAVVHLARAVAAIGGSRLPIRYNETVRAYLEGIAGPQPPALREQIRRILEPASADAAIDAVFVEPAARARTRAMLRDTASPTMLQAGMRINVIPSLATCEVDCRILPGSRPADLAASLKEVLRKAGIGEEVSVELQRPDGSVAAESPVRGPLVDAMRAALGRHAPDGDLVPTLSSGATDGRFFRPLGVPVYGFSPSLPGEAMEGVHGIDERITIRSLEFGMKVVWDVISRFCA